jgi:hypothetical protein
MFDEPRMLVLKKVGSTMRTEILNGASSTMRASERPREFQSSKVHMSFKSVSQPTPRVRALKPNTKSLQRTDEYQQHWTC